MVFDAMNTDFFQCFLDQLAQTIPPEPGKRRILFLDNASWHKAERLVASFRAQVSAHLQPRLQSHRTALAALKSRLFHRLHRPHSRAIHRAPLTALKAFMDDPYTVASQCATRK